MIPHCSGFFILFMTEKETEMTHEEMLANTLMGKMIADVKDRGISHEDLIEGTVIAIERRAIYIDLGTLGTGIIYGREYMNARDIVRNINIGDPVKGKVITAENEEGYIELSLKEAKQALIWKEADKAMRDKTQFALEVKEANKGGLLVFWQGIEGFLPASQLSQENYPRVEDGDKDRILDELKKLVGQKLELNIIGVNPKEGKLIFSEKGKDKAEKQVLVTKYGVGDAIQGEVTGTTDFGVFLKLEEGLEGLVHISELDWALVEDPKKLYNVGDTAKAKIIEIKDGKVSLSIKQLKENPWITAANSYKPEQEVSGVVIKHNKHGALVAIEAGVAGLIHVSEFGDDTTLRENLEIGKSYPFKINVFEPTQQKMTLSFAGEKKAK
jgi:small subunit ribosomal protein S1